MIEVRTLGGLSLLRDGVPVGGRAAQRHQVALLAILATSPGRSASRDKLIAFLWPARETSKARHRLSVALHVLRSELGRDALLVSQDVVALNPDAVWSDVSAFQEALADGRLGEAAELFRGPFLDGFFLGGSHEYERWMDTERAHVDTLYRACLDRLVEEAEAAHDAHGAVRWWERLATHDPFSASSTLGLMKALARLGDFGAAIRHGRAYAALVNGELGIPPAPEVLELGADLTRRARDRALMQTALSEEGSAPPGEALPAPSGVDEVGLVRRPLLQARGALLSVAGAAVLVVGGGWLVMREAGMEAPPSPLAVAVLDFDELGSPVGLGHTLAARIAATLDYVPQLSGQAQGAQPSRDGNAVVTGSVQRRGERTTVRVALDRGSPDRAWTAEYEVQSGRSDGVVEEVSLDIASDLREALVAYAPKEYTASRRAYDRFLQGVYAMRRANAEDMWQALQFHREAWEEDPRFALAHAIAGSAYLWLIGRGVSHAMGMELAREHTEEALALDPTLAEGHAGLGYIQIWGEHDFQAGAESLRRAIMLYPTLPQAHAWYGFYLLYVEDRPDAAVRHVRRALEVDPLNTGRSRDVEWALYRARRYDEVEAQASVTWSLDADVTRQLTGSPIANAYRELGRYDDSVREFELVRERTAGTGAGTAITYGRMGRTDEALAIAREIEERPGGGPAYGLARIYANAGASERAFQWLERAATERPDVILQMVAEPSFDPIRADPRFDAMVTRIGIPR